MLTRHTPLERGKALRASGRKSAKRRKAAHERCFGAPRPGDGDTRDAELKHGVQLRSTAKAIAERLTDEGYP